MKKKLFQEVFQKAKKQSGSVTRNGLSNHLENIFDSKLGMRITAITFVRYYKKYIENDEAITNNPNADLLNKAAEYLGCKNYEDFVTKKALKNNDGKDEEDDDRVIITSNSGEEIKDGFFIWVKSNRKVVIINTVVLFIITVIISSDILSKKKSRWMSWQKNHYIEVQFDPNKYQKDQLEIYDQHKLEVFKKVLNPDCTTKYFNDKKEPITWYYKKGKGNLEIFTAPGLHPTNGKTLKKITRYIIRKHICKEF